MGKFFCIFFIIAMLLGSNYQYAFAENKSDTSKLAYQIETIDTNKTLVQMFFKNIEGDYIYDEIKTSFIDITTNKMVENFTRTVNENKEPNVILFNTDGNYNIFLEGQKNAIVKGVPITKNKLNKITLMLPNGTLLFTYQSNRARPVNHQVMISKMNHTTKNKITDAKCTEKISLIPSKYYIEVDILPKYKLHTEVSFGATTEVQIPQEGKMTINNVTNVGAIKLYYQMGNTYQEFTTVSATGDNSEISLLLRPGLYKASFNNNNNEEIEINFQIKTNVATKFDLKDYGEMLVAPEPNALLIYYNP